MEEEEYVLFLLMKVQRDKKKSERGRNQIATKKV